MPMVIILIGVAGSGKTTVGRLLATRLGCEFHDGDDLHPTRNREKMSRGIALTDEDRSPWLHAIRDLVERCLAENRSAVIACSALKQKYRDLLDRRRGKGENRLSEGIAGADYAAACASCRSLLRPASPEEPIRNAGRAGGCDRSSISLRRRRKSPTRSAPVSVLKPGRRAHPQRFVSLATVLKLFRAQPPLSRLDVLTHLLGSCRAANHT